MAGDGGECERAVVEGSCNAYAQAFNSSAAIAGWDEST